MNDESHLPQDEASEIKLTAFALGELSEAERSEFLAQSLDAAADLREVAEIARLGELIRRLRREEPCPAATGDLRQALEARLALESGPALQARQPLEAGPAAPAEPPKLAPASGAYAWPKRRYWLPLSLAASLLVIAGAAMGLMHWRHNEQRQVADANGLIAERLKEVDDLPERSLRDDVVVTASDVADAGGEPQQGEGMVSMPSGGDSSNGVVTFEAARSEAALDLGEPADLASPQQEVQGSLGMPLTGRGGAIRPALGGAALGGSPMGGSPMGGSPMGGGGGKNATIRSAGGGQSGSSYFPTLNGPSTPRFTGPQVTGTQVTGSQPPAGGEPRRESISSFGGISATPKPAAAASPGGQGAAGAGGFGGMRGATMVGGMMGGGQMPPTNHLAGTPAEAGASALPGLQQGLQSSDLYSVASGESYAPIVESPFLKVVDSPLSTFGIDVDTASYANVRRFLNAGQLPPPDAVRIEELVNYFSYSYPQPEAGAPFSVNAEVAGCPWNAEHRLLKIGLKGREIARERRPASNLVFLLDVSGSMKDANKLPLVKESMLLLTEQLGERDRVAIVVYADRSEVALASTSGADKRAIETAVSALEAGGSTNGGQGIQTAYETARTHFIKEGVNRVILATDGDFNVGVTDQGELVRLIEEQAKGGVFFTALGFGCGNLKDGTLERLADKGNGNYAYIDTLGEARKALVDQLSGTLVTIAKDVKVQIEFNPAQVGAFRLIGYENRVLAAADFNDDRKDAGEIGAGHTVTALYELVPARAAVAAAVDELKYQRVEPALKPAADSGELLTLKLRYKEPDGDKSRLLEHAVSDAGKRYNEASRDFKFAASVAAFGMLLRHSSYAGDANFDAVLELAGEALDSDLDGYRAEFVALTKKAKELSGQRAE